jgi:hypothetical protein
MLGVFGKLFIFELDESCISSIECIIDSLGDLGGIPQSLSSQKVYMIREYLLFNHVDGRVAVSSLLSHK